jgi:hypothetical protein
MLVLADQVNEGRGVFLDLSSLGDQQVTVQAL